MEIARLATTELPCYDYYKEAKQGQGQAEKQNKKTRGGKVKRQDGKKPTKSQENTKSAREGGYQRMVFFLILTHPRAASALNEIRGPIERCLSELLPLSPSKFVEPGMSFLQDRRTDGDPLHHFKKHSTLPPLLFFEP
jgi:hypothetical protein